MLEFRQTLPATHNQAKRDQTPGGTEHLEISFWDRYTDLILACKKLIRAGDYLTAAAPAISLVQPTGPC